MPFDRSINPYRGCEHGCIYCFARPTHAYLGLSPGLDFETRILFKPDAAKLLTAELAAPKYRPDVVAMGTNTDPYQPVERELKITRSILQVLSDFNNPVGIVTKNHMVTRDIDILADMARRNLAEVFLSVTTLDKELARDMEPRASAPHRRLDAIKALADAGVPVGVMTAPMIPGLNDHEMEAILEAATEAGATRAGFTVLRLPLEIKDLFDEWLRANRPDRAEKVLSLIRQMRGGALYQAEFGLRMKGEGPIAQLLSARFQAGGEAARPQQDPLPPRHAALRGTRIGAHGVGRCKARRATDEASLIGARACHSFRGSWATARSQTEAIQLTRSGHGRESRRARTARAEIRYRRHPTPPRRA